MHDSSLSDLVMHLWAFPLQHVLVCVYSRSEWKEGEQRGEGGLPHLGFQDAGEMEGSVRNGLPLLPAPFFIPSLFPYDPHLPVTSTPITYHYVIMVGLCSWIW
jgi:hypothetical protein